MTLKELRKQKAEGICYDISIKDGKEILNIFVRSLSGRITCVSGNYKKGQTSFSVDGKPTFPENWGVNNYPLKGFPKSEWLNTTTHWLLCSNICSGSWLQIACQLERVLALAYPDTFCK